jgi:PIN domain nuclease of toxin-antitoxin system
LLDTHVFLWWTTNDPKLSTKARDLIRDPHNSLSFSVVSAWEILLKARAGRSPIPGNLAKFFESNIQYHNFAVLDLHLAHLIKLYSLPTRHRDPFDQLLVAQAQTENLPIITIDAKMADYDVEVIW